MPTLTHSARSCSSATSSPPPPTTLTRSASAPAPSKASREFGVCDLDDHDIGFGPVIAPPL